MQLIKLKGKIKFEVPNLTKKHHNQSEWKRVAMIEIKGEHCEYYAWFIQKRFNIKLNKPIRGAHITFINDRFSEIIGETLEEKEKIWDLVKDKYHNVNIEVYLSVDPRTNGQFWWLNVPQEHRSEIHSIRKELGLDRPFFGLHLTIGRADHLELEQSNYIHSLIQKNLIN